MTDVATAGPSEGNGQEGRRAGETRAEVRERLPRGQKSKRWR